MSPQRIPRAPCQAAKWRLMLGGEAQRDAEGRSVSMPIVIRGPQGGGHRLSAQHSQSLEAWFTAVPGLKVVMPSTPHDEKGLLLAAVRDPNPVIFLGPDAMAMPAHETVLSKDALAGSIVVSNQSPIAVRAHGPGWAA